MPAYLVLPILIAVLYALVNVGSKHKVPLAKIAPPLVVVCAMVYVASSLLPPLANFLMQLGTHIRLP